MNSLFGDGVAAALVSTDSGDPEDVSFIIRDFQSHIITDAIDAMRYELEEGKLSFHLDRDIPYVIGSNVETPVGLLLG